MLKIMLVDDNHLALEYFSHLVSWKDEGFELVCTAGDGEAALVYFKKYNPDVVITDVQMPNMDGIALTKAIRALAPDTVVIFLSSYEEFSYIRSAMELDAFDYLLKHEMDSDSLRAKLRKIRETIENRSADKRFIAEGLLSSWLNNQNGESAQTFDDNLTARFPSKYDMSIIMEDRILPVLTSWYCPPSKNHNSLIRSILYQDPSTEAVLQRDAHTWLVVNNAGEHALTRAYRWKEQFHKEDISLSFLLIAEDSTIIKGISQYLSLDVYKSQKYFYHTGTVLTAAMLHQQTAVPTRISENELIGLLNSHRFSEACQLLDQQYISIQQAFDSDAFQALCQVFCSVMSMQDNKLWNASSRSMFTMFDPSSDLSLWYDIPSVFSWLKERFTFMVGLLDNVSWQRHIQGTGKVLSYIQTHYSDSDLGAEAIAAAFDVSVNRMNALIKKETGSTLWKLLIQVRMEEAGKLLRTTTLPIAEVVNQTGYKTMSHFADSFRKYYHMTPSEYRRQENDAL